MDLNRIAVIAKNVFWEVIRDQVLYLIGLFAVLMLFASQFIPFVAGGGDAKILMDLGLAGIEFCGLIIAVFVGTGLTNKEIEKRTVLVLLAKPVGPGEFILGKYLGLSAVLAILLAAMGISSLLALKLAGVTYSLGSLSIATLYIFLQLALMTAVALALGVFTSSLLATLLTFGVYLMGHLSQDLVELGQLTKSPSLQRFTEGLFLILPDLSRLNLKNDAVYNLLPDTNTLINNATYGIAYTALLLGIATIIFSRREF